MMIGWPGLKRVYGHGQEFNRILASLYNEKGYILIDIHEIFEERTNNGRTELVRKDCGCRRTGSRSFCQLMT